MQHDDDDDEGQRTELAFQDDGAPAASLGRGPAMPFAPPQRSAPAQLQRSPAPAPRAAAPVARNDFDADQPTRVGPELSARSEFDTDQPTRVGPELSGEPEVAATVMVNLDERAAAALPRAPAFGAAAPLAAATPYGAAAPLAAPAPLQAPPAAPYHPPQPAAQPAAQPAQPAPPAVAAPASPPARAAAPSRGPGGLPVWVWIVGGAVTLGLGAGVAAVLSK